VGLESARREADDEQHVASGSASRPAAVTARLASPSIAIIVALLALGATGASALLPSSVSIARVKFTLGADSAQWVK
jgi:hypothetical protein